MMAEAPMTTQLIDDTDDDSYSYRKLSNSHSIEELPAVTNNKKQDIGRPMLVYSILVTDKINVSDCLSYSDNNIHYINIY